MKIKIKKLHENAVIPSYAKEGDAGFDLTAVSVEEREQFIQYNTGLAFEIPEGHVGLIFPRSSVTKKDLMLKNSVGIIDSGYRGEVSFRFKGENFKNSSFGQFYSSNVYDVGDRVGQMMIMPVPKVEFEEVDELSNSERGEGGYGSSGK